MSFFVMCFAHSDSWRLMRKKKKCRKCSEHSTPLIPPAPARAFVCASDDHQRRRVAAPARASTAPSCPRCLPSNGCYALDMISLRPCADLFGDGGGVRGQTERPRAPSSTVAPCIGGPRAAGHDRRDAPPPPPGRTAAAAGTHRRRRRDAPPPGAPGKEGNF